MNFTEKELEILLLENDADSVIGRLVDDVKRQRIRIKKLRAKDRQNRQCIADYAADLMGQKREKLKR